MSNPSGPSSGAWPLLAHCGQSVRQGRALRQHHRTVADRRSAVSPGSRTGSRTSLAEDRDELIRLNFRFVVLPESSNDQWSLAQELGLRHVDGDVELSLWEVVFERFDQLKGEPLVEFSEFEDHWMEFISRVSMGNSN